MTSRLSFHEHVAWLVAEHERLQQSFRNLTAQNSSLRDRLKTVGEDIGIPESASDLNHDGSQGSISTVMPSKLTGNWDEVSANAGEEAPAFERGQQFKAISGNVGDEKAFEKGQQFEELTRPLSSAQRFATQVTHTRSSADAFDEFPPQLLPEWTQAGVQESSISLGMLPHQKRQTMICGESVIDSRSWLQHFIMRPNSVHKAFWDFLSMFVLGYDILFIPLEVFAYDHSYFTMCMEWGSTIFWTCDVLAVFLTGFHRDGVVEMRPRMIAIRYLRGKFWMDALVVLLDWVLAIFTVQIRAVVRVGKTARAIRIFRLVRAMRLLRTFKLARSAQTLFQYLKSELARTLISVLLMLFVLVVFNHYFACGWYALGTSTTDGWLQSSAQLEDCDWAYCYATALHWSLTQFTPASMEVFPTNLGERIYTIFVLLFALVTFSSFVSSITSAMVHLRKLQTEPAQQEAILRQYFQESRISAELSQRIWMFLQNNHFQHRKRIHREDLDVLKMVPESLRILLNEELYVPILVWNPLLRHMEKLHPTLIGEVCHQCISETGLITQEELFLECKPAEKMSFITSGTMDYSHHDASLCTTVKEGQWTCEPALWLHWSYCGRLTANTSCEIIQLNVRAFRALASKDRLAYSFLCAYAKHFRAYLMNDARLWYTDIWTDLHELEEVLARVEESHPFTHVTTKTSNGSSCLSDPSMSSYARVQSIRKRLCSVFRTSPGRLGAIATV